MCEKTIAWGNPGEESEIKVIIFQGIAGMLSASLFRQRFLVGSSSYYILFWNL